MRSVKAFTAKRSRYLAVAGLLCTLAALLLLSLSPLFLRRIDRVLYDFYLKRMTKSAPSEVPILVDIDEDSLKKYGQWPWPRYRMAELLAALRNGGVAAVGLDILMAEPDRTSPKLWSERISEDFGITVNLEDLPPGLADNDAHLASVLAQIPVVLAAQLTDSSSDRPEGEVPLFPITELRAPGAPPLTSFLPESEGLVPPTPELARAASAIGLMNAEGDEDGLFRRVPLLLSWKGKPIASLALATLALASETGSLLVRVSRDGPESIRVAEIDIPLSAGAAMPILFKGGSGLYSRFGAADILEGKVPSGKLAGRIAFVGSTTAGLKDLRAVPFDRNYPGLELHAAVLDTILSGKFITEPGWAVGMSALLVLATGFMSALVFNFVPPPYSFFLAGGIFLGLLAGPGFFMDGRGVYVSPLSPLFLLVLQTLCSVSLSFWLDEKDKRMLRQAFSHYVSPRVVDRVIEEGGSDSLRGEQREITMLFTDIRGFSTIAEKMAPFQVVDILNRFFAPMTTFVKDSMGTVDKFIGDAMVAFWNAPLSVPDHPVRAVASLLDMLQALEELNVDFKKDYGITLCMGGGIHTGDAHVGNMGTRELITYTAVGNTVNTASRLEGLCSKYGVQSIISGATAEFCRGRFTLKPLDVVRVRGKTQNIPIFSVTTLEEGRQREGELSRWQDAYALYLFGDFDESYGLCSLLQKEHPDEKLYQIFMERTRKLMKDTPENWDGVFTHEDK